jgi:hypothetical protein
MSNYLNWLGNVGIRLSLAVCYDASSAVCLLHTRNIFFFEQFIWFESFESKILNIKFYNNLLYRKDWLDDKVQHAFLKMKSNMI